MPAITLDQSIDGEFIITATDRISGAVLAAAMGYYCDDVSMRVDMQLIELGFQIYAPEIY